MGHQPVVLSRVANIRGEVVYRSIVFAPVLDPTLLYIDLHLDMRTYLMLCSKGTWVGSSTANLPLHMYILELCLELFTCHWQTYEMLRSRGGGVWRNNVQWHLHAFLMPCYSLALHLHLHTYLVHLQPVKVKSTRVFRRGKECNLHQVLREMTSPLGKDNKFSYMIKLQRSNTWHEELEMSKMCGNPHSVNIIQ